MLQSDWNWALSWRTKVGSRNSIPSSRSWVASCRELGPLFGLVHVIGVIGDDPHVDPGDRGGERITNLRVTEVANPQPDLGLRRIDRPDDGGPASLRLGEERRGFIQRTSPSNGTHFGCRDGRHIGRCGADALPASRRSGWNSPGSDAHVPT